MNPGRVLGPCRARGLGWRQGRREMQAGVAGDRSVLAHDWDARGQLGHGDLAVGLHPRGLPGRLRQIDWNRGWPGSTLYLRRLSRLSKTRRSRMIHWGWRSSRGRTAASGRYPTRSRNRNPTAGCGHLRSGGPGHRGLELPAPIGMSWGTPCCSVHGESLAGRANRSLISRYHACGGERHEASGGMGSGTGFCLPGPLMVHGATAWPGRRVAQRARAGRDAAAPRRGTP